MIIYPDIYPFLYPFNIFFMKIQWQAASLKIDSHVPARCGVPGKKGEVQPREHHGLATTGFTLAPGIFFGIFLVEEDASE